MPGVTVTISSPSMQGTRTAPTTKAPTASRRSRPATTSHLRARRLLDRGPRRYPGRPWLYRRGERRAENRLAHGKRDGQRPIAGRRRRHDEDVDQLRLAAAGGAAQRPRFLGDSRGRAGHPDAAHRRRRQRRGHADRLFHLRHQVGSAPADGRRHRQHRRHQRRRVLLRLRLGRGSLGDHRRQRRRTCRGPA